MVRRLLFRDGLLRDEKHICNDVIQSERNKSSCRPPDCNNLARSLSARDADEDSEAHKPVCTNSAQEDLVPLWIHRLLDSQRDCCIAVGRRFLEYASVSGNDGHEEEGACEISEEGDDPVLNHIPKRDATVKERSPHELGRGKSDDPIA